MTEKQKQAFVNDLKSLTDDRFDEMDFCWLESDTDGFWLANAWFEIDCPLGFDIEITFQNPNNSFHRAYLNLKPDTRNYCQIKKVAESCIAVFEKHGFKLLSEV